MNHRRPILVWQGVVAFGALAIVMWLAVGALQSGSKQTLYDNQLSACERDNVTRHNLTHGLSVPLRQLTATAAKIRHIEASTAPTPSERAADLAAARLYQQAHDEVQIFPQVNCSAVLRQP